VNRNVQTTLVPAGGATLVEFQLQVPGNYLLVDHSILRAFNKGALGMIKVEGPPAVAIYSGRVATEVYRPEGGAVQVVTPSPGVTVARTRAAQIEFGRAVFTQNCAPCHQPNGRGIAAAFPPLAGSDYLNADKQRAMAIVVNGLQGRITVNGEVYNGVMPALRLNDEDVANVLTYVFSQWGNAGHVVTPAEVRAARRAAPARRGSSPDGH
jgi:nitrite reductase (NO-forming)